MVDIVRITRGLPWTKKEPIIPHLKRYYWLYIFLVPGFAYLLIFKYLPMYGIIIAFKDFDYVKGVTGSDWVGLKHFKFIFCQSNDFYRVLFNSVWLSVLRLLWGFPMPIIMALMLNEIRSIRYKRILQTTIYLPHFISWVVIIGIVYNFLSPSSGVVNLILNEMGMQPVPFLQKPEYFRSIVVVASIWKEAGWGTIMYLAAMAGISTEIYEAAIIDGANRIQRIFYITLPGIINVIIVILVLNVGNILYNGFEQVFLLSNPLVYDVSDVFETYTYRLGLKEGQFSLATAIGMFQSIVGLVMIYISNAIAKLTGEGGLW